MYVCELWGRSLHGPRSHGDHRSEPSLQGALGLLRHPEARGYSALYILRYWIYVFIICISYNRYIQNRGAWACAFALLHSVAYPTPLLSHSSDKSTDLKPPPSAQCQHHLAWAPLPKPKKDKKKTNGKKSQCHWPSLVPLGLVIFVSFSFFCFFVLVIDVFFGGMG